MSATITLNLAGASTKSKRFNLSKFVQGWGFIIYIRLDERLGWTLDCLYSAALRTRTIARKHTHTRLQCRACSFVCISGLHQASWEEVCCKQHLLCISEDHCTNLPRMNRSCSSCGWLDRFGRLPLLPLLPLTNNRQTARARSGVGSCPSHTAPAPKRSSLLACRQAMQLRCEVAASEHAALIDERHWFAPAASSSSTLASSPSSVSPSSSASSERPGHEASEGAQKRNASWASWASKTDWATAFRSVEYAEKSLETFKGSTP